MMKITPRGKQVLIEPDGEASRVSQHGIISPDNEEQETKAIGTVIAVGSNVEDIKKDDRVIYGTFAGEEIKLEETDKDVDFILVDEEWVLGFVTD